MFGNNNMRNIVYDPKPYVKKKQVSGYPIFSNVFKFTVKFGFPTL